MKCEWCDGIGWQITLYSTAFHPEEPDPDPCPYCFEIGGCPECSALLNECDEHGHNVCHVCGWSSLAALDKMMEAHYGKSAR